VKPLLNQSIHFKIMKGRGIKYVFSEDGYQGRRVDIRK
jgi:hypothetical protein